MTNFTRFAIYNISIIKEAYQFVKKGGSEGVAPFTMEWKLKGANIKEGDCNPLYFSELLNKSWQNSKLYYK